MEFPQNTTHKHSPDIPSIPMDMFLSLPLDKQAAVTEKTYEGIRALLEQNGFSEHGDVNEVYRSLPSETAMVVRNENPDAVITLLTKGSYNIGFTGDIPYANCVEWKPSDGARHLRNTYLEGFGNKNGIVTIIGIDEHSALTTKKLPDSTEQFLELDRDGVRSTSGTVELKDVAFITLRMPLTLYPEHKLTDDELDRKHEYEQRTKGGEKLDPVFVQRGFIRPVTTH